MTSPDESSTNATEPINEELFQRIVQLSPVPMAIHVDGTVVLANKAAAKLMGAKSPKELLNVNVLEYVHPDSKKAVVHRIKLLAKGEREYTEVLEEKLIRFDGKVIDVEIVSLLVQYQGKPSIQLILRDITKQKLADKELLSARDHAVAERKRLYSLLSEVPALVAITRGPEHIFELANAEFLKVTGKSPDIIGKSVQEVFPELYDQVVAGSLARIYRTGKPYRGTEGLLRLDAKGDGKLEDRYFDFVYQPTHDTDGKVDGVMVHAIDVTQQVQIRREIEEREQQYRSIFEASHDAILISTMSGKLVEANPAALAMYGYTYEEILKLHTQDFIYPDDTRTRRNINEAIRKGEMFSDSGKYRAKDDKPVYAEVTVTGIVYKKKPHLMSVVRDITKRMRSEEALSYTNVLLKTVTDNASAGLIMTDEQQRCTFMNRAAEKITGYSLRELQEQNKPLHGMVHYLHPDGTDYPIEKCPIDNAIQKKRRQRGEDFFVRPDGTFYPVRFIASPIINDGVTLGTVIEIEDMTEIRKTKEAFMEASARRKELEDLNKSKDEFISLASHQLRTPATAVKQYIAMILEGYVGQVPATLRQFIEKAYQSNERQISIVNDLLKVAQVDAGKVRLRKTQFDVVELIQSILDDDASKFAKRQQKVTFRHTGAPKISADRHRLRMALENIIDNASKYTPSGKAISIRVRTLKQSVSIDIQDQGVGMSLADIEKIFGKFVRIDNQLSLEAGGTGLGLYWARKIIDLHGGNIKVDSTPGKGSRFTIKLPLNS